MRYKRIVKDVFDILIVIIEILIITVAFYTYKNYDLKWYVFTAIVFIIVPLLALLSSMVGTDIQTSSWLQFINLFVITIFSFFMEPLYHRIILMLAITITTEKFFSPLKHHDQKSVVRNEYATIFLHLIFLASFIYFAVKANGLQRWINVIFAIISFILVGLSQGNVENIQEYDEQEDAFNESNFKEATSKTFKEVINDPGLRAEYLVSTWLTDIESYHKVLHNVYTPPYGKRFISEIDAVVICRAGILCIEVKNQSKHWVIKGEGKNDAYAYDQYGNLLDGFQQNPFYQNKIHQENLKHFIERFKKYEIVQKSLDCIGGYVVFGFRTKGTNISFENIDQGCSYYSHIGEVINETCKERNYLSDKDIDILYKFLKCLENNEQLKASHQKILDY